MKMRCIVLLVLSAISFTAMSSGDSAAGKQKSVRCASCHGMEGKKPRLASLNLTGKDASYLEQALQAYKKGERKGGQAEVMRAYVLGLSDKDLSDLAAYYSGLPEP